MTIRHLHIFLTVYSEMSITKAARKLHLAQPSVSLAIRELEERYQIRLFDRINRRLFITEAGERFYEYASHIMHSFEEMESVMSSPGSIGNIYIGSSITIGNYLIPSAVDRFQTMYPQCKVYVTVQNSQQIIHKVLKNELDFGVVEDKVHYEQLEEIPFQKDRLVFICGKEHPLSGRKSVSLEEMCSYPFFMREPGSASREITDYLMKSTAQSYDIMWESASNQVLIHGVQKLPGIAVLSKRLVEKEVREGRIHVLPFMPEIFERQFSIVYHRQKYIHETLKQFMDIIAKSLEESNHDD